MSQVVEHVENRDRSQAEAASTPLQTDEGDDQEEQGGGCLFSCRCESARSVSTLLSCLKSVGSSTEENFGYATPMTVFCSPTCLTFHISGKSRQCQASVDMQAGLFSDYRVLGRGDKENGQNDDWQAGGEFCVNLVTVLECLHVLGSSGPGDTTPLCLSYDLDTEIFRMELFDDGGVLSTAALPGVVPSPTDNASSLALAFRSTPIVARMICNSQILKEAMHELELVHGATCCTVALSNQQGLEFATVGDAGECLVSLPASSTLLLESEADKAQTYPLQSLKSGMRAVDIAQETCVSINEAGMMAIQHQVLDNVGTGQPNFVDFIMGCLQDDEEEENDEEKENMNVAKDISQEDISATHTSLASQQADPQSSMVWNDNDDNSSPAPQDRLGSSRSDDNSISNHDNPPLPQDRMESDHPFENKDDSDDDSLPPPVSTSVQSLFGSVVVGKTSGTRRRKRTSRPRSSSSRYLSSNAGSDNSDDDSQSLLPSQQEDESQPLDVTAPARPTRRRRSSNDDHYDGSSSPEIGYGPEMTQDDF